MRQRGNKFLHTIETVAMNVINKNTASRTKIINQMPCKVFEVKHVRCKMQRVVVMEDEKILR